MKGWADVLQNTIGLKPKAWEKNFPNATVAVRYLYRCGHTAVCHLPLDAWAMALGLLLLFYSRYFLTTIMVIDTLRILYWKDIQTWVSQSRGGDTTRQLPSPWMGETDEGIRPPSPRLSSSARRSTSAEPPKQQDPMWTQALRGDFSGLGISSATPGGPGGHLLRAGLAVPSLTPPRAGTTYQNPTIHSSTTDEIISSSHRSRSRHHRRHHHRRHNESLETAVASLLLNAGDRIGASVPHDDGPPPVQRQRGLLTSATLIASMAVGSTMRWRVGQCVSVAYEITDFLNEIAPVRTAFPHVFEGVVEDSVAAWVMDRLYFIVSFLFSALLLTYVCLAYTEMRGAKLVVYAVLHLLARHDFLPKSMLQLCSSEAERWEKRDISRPSFHAAPTGVQLKPAVYQSLGVQIQIALLALLGFLYQVTHFSDGVPWLMIPLLIPVRLLDQIIGVFT